jgi:pSer/pThr/pTyr-binding forkhead associated (FHA) protein
LIRPDGTEGESFPLGDGATVVGRDSAGPFASDAYLSPQHAEFRFEGDSVVVSDKSSLNGIFRKIDPEQPVPLATGAVFRVGQEILRFEALPEPEKTSDGTELMGSPNPGFIGRIRLVVGRDGYGSSYCVPPGGMHLGRDRGDIIFPDDGYVSGLHCRIHGEPGDVQLTDVGSSNGTFIRLEEPTPLPTGTLLLMGMQLFRVEY